MFKPDKQLVVEAACASVALVLFFGGVLLVVATLLSQ